MTSQLRSPKPRVLSFLVPAFAPALLLVLLVGCRAEVKINPPPPRQPTAAPAPPPPAPKLENITVSDRIEFETAKAVLLPQSMVLLNEVVKTLKDNPQVTLVEIGGHTDSVGESDANLMLSQARAESVRAYLMSQGVDGSRMRAMGYGDRVTVAPNDDELGRQKNRRVEFRIKKQGQ